MTNESASSEMKSLWQSQPNEFPRISVEDLGRKMQRFERGIFRRNIGEYAAGAFVFVAFGYYEWKLAGLLVRLGSGMTMAGVLYMMFQIHRRGALRPTPAEFGLRSGISFHQHELERQRDLLLTVWSWYLLPFVPGLVVFLTGSAVNQWAAHPQHMGRLVMRFGILAGFTCALFFAIWKLNQRGAEALQAEIDELKALCECRDESAKEGYSQGPVIT